MCEEIRGGGKKFHDISWYFMIFHDISWFLPTIPSPWSRPMSLSCIRKLSIMGVRHPVWNVTRRERHLWCIPSAVDSGPVLRPRQLEADPQRGSYWSDTRGHFWSPALYGSYSISVYYHSSCNAAHKHAVTICRLELLLDAEPQGAW